MNSIRILIADDHPVVQDGLVAVLNTQPDFEIVVLAATGCASSGPEQPDRAARSQPVQDVQADPEVPAEAQTMYEQAVAVMASGDFLDDPESFRQCPRSG